MKESHRQVVGTALMGSKLFFKVKQGEKGMGGIETFLIFAVASLNFAIVSGDVGTNQFMLNIQLSGDFLKKSRDIPFASGKTVRKLKSVVGLDTFNADDPYEHTI